VVEGSTDNKVVNLLFKIAVQAARDVIRFGNEFGLSPSSRARVTASPIGHTEWWSIKKQTSIPMC
jgi:phage terminase small subunit